MSCCTAHVLAGGFVGFVACFRDKADIRDRVMPPDMALLPSHGVRRACG